MTINDFDQSFKTVDAALLSHGTIANTSSSSLRQFRNAQRSPIYQLPLEILTTVLIYASGILDDSPELLNRSSLGKPMINIVLALAHVSSGWYKVVESLPILWTHILADLPPPLIRMAVVRSKTLPLTVTCWSRSNGKRKELLEELSLHTHRWEVACLGLAMKDLKRITQHHALRLKAFLLMPLAENQRESYAGLAEEIPMAKELFQGQMPKLELLKIPYWLKWDEIAYPKLKQLHIKYCAGDLPSVENLIRMMSACPMLESLSISAPVHDRNSGFLSVPNLNLAHLQIIRIENFEYLALASLLLRLHLPVVKTVGIALDEPLQDNATMGVFMTAMKPVIQRMSDLAETISVGLDQKDGVQLAFYTSTTHTSIKLSNFRWTGVMKAAMSASKAFLERTKYLKVTGGGGVRLSSTGTELVELVTSLRFLNEMTLDGSPNSAELLSMLLNAGNRDVQPLKGAALWQHLMAIELEGCLCDEMDDLLLILEEWKDRRKKKLQKCLPHISIRPGGCGFCGYLRRALERLVEEGEQCSEAESDDEAEGQ